MRHADLSCMEHTTSSEGLFHSNRIALWHFCYKGATLPPPPPLIGPHFKSPIQGCAEISDGCVPRFLQFQTVMQKSAHPDRNCRDLAKACEKSLRHSPPRSSMFRAANSGSFATHLLRRSSQSPIRALSKGRIQLRARYLRQGRIHPALFLFRTGSNPKTNFSSQTGGDNRTARNKTKGNVKLHVKRYGRI